MFKNEIASTCANRPYSKARNYIKAILFKKRLEHIKILGDISMFNNETENGYVVHRMEKQDNAAIYVREHTDHKPEISKTTEVVLIENEKRN